MIKDQDAQSADLFLIPTSLHHPLLVCESMILHEISGRVDVSVYVLPLCNSAPYQLGYVTNMSVPTSLCSLESGLNLHLQFAKLFSKNPIRRPTTNSVAGCTYCFSVPSPVNSLLPRQPIHPALCPSESLVDVTLSCEGQSLKAHKLVLSACSPYFKALFQEHVENHPIVILKGRWRHCVRESRTACLCLFIFFSRTTTFFLDFILFQGIAVA